MGNDPLDRFQANRPRLFGLAYRMLGSASEAEDIVQETYLRWAARAEEVDTPEAWLTRVVTNLCLTHLTSARVRREAYPGPWLPEPVATGGGALGPMETAEQRDSVSFGLLLLMERLTPPERAVFVLREAFGHSHREIAAILDVEEAHSRQLHRRARERVGRADGRRFAVDDRQRRRIVERFLAASLEGDLGGLERMLADDVTAWSDGGGRVSAARRPVLGAAKVLRLLTGLARRPEIAAAGFTIDEVNGVPALVVHTGGGVFGVLIPEVGDDGRVGAVHMVVNPEKLARVGGTAE